MFFIYYLSKFNFIIVKKDPIISIILPVYNGENFIHKAIESILSQSFSDFELIIVNDCSTDTSTEIIECFAKKDYRIKHLFNTINKKLPASLNIGHKIASGKFITWTSHDNILYKNHLERLHDFIIDSNSDIIYSDFEIIDENDSVIDVIKTGPCECIIFENCIGASFLYKKNVYDVLIAYNEKYFFIEDYDFWLRASLQFKFVKLNEILYRYRIHSDNLRSKIKNNELEHNQYNYAYNEMIVEFTQSLNWNKNSLNFLMKLNNDKKILVSEFFSIKNILYFDFDKLKGRYQDPNVIKERLISKVRNEFLRNADNQSVKNIIKSLLFERKLLFKRGYSIKKSTKLILKSLMKLY